MNAYMVGVDVGSTSIKLLVTGTDGRQELVASRRSPWRSGEHGRAEMSAALVMDTVRELAHEADSLLSERGSYRVLALGVSGMAEAGVVLDPDGRPAAPILAWFDPRGAEEILATPEAFRAEFLGRTGLPVGPLASIAKLLHLRGTGVDLHGQTFLNVPEYVVHSLGVPVWRSTRSSRAPAFSTRTTARRGTPRSRCWASAPTCSPSASARGRPSGSSPTTRCRMASAAPSSRSRATTTSCRPSRSARSTAASSTTRWEPPKRSCACSTNPCPSTRANASPWRASTPSAMCCPASTSSSPAPSPDSSCGGCCRCWASRMRRDGPASTTR
ncbi:hypothetical protein K1X59_04055 [Microbacterium sp. Se5.02b]|nr:hypothetical protein K1X59_04055 [Microbacterium sp. Se5.02b]